MSRSGRCVAGAALQRFSSAVGRPGASYEELWRWSVEDLDAFWAAIWKHFEVDGGYDCVLRSREMPGAAWFPLIARTGPAEP